MNVYEASLEFQTKDDEKERVARSLVIQFKSPGKLEAISDVLSVKLWQVETPAIDAAGYLPSSIIAHTYEWKVDFPWAYGECVK